MRQERILIRVLLVLFGALLMCTAQSVSAQGITVHQAIDRSIIPYEEAVTMDITLTWPGSQFLYRFDKPLSPELDRLKIKEYSTTISSTGTGDAETTTKHFRMTLVPTSAGKATISPITISYLKWPDSVAGEVVTEAMSVSIADPKPVSSDKMRLVDWVKLIGSIVGLFAAGFVYFLRRQRSKTKVVKVAPKEKFLTDLTTLKNEAGSDLKKFQTGLYKILSDYLTESFALSTDRLNNDDVSELLQATDLSETQRTKLGGWFSRARADRFRPVDPMPGETIRIESEIRQFFEQLTK